MESLVDALILVPTGEWPFTLKMIVGAPLIGMASAYSLMVIVYWLFRNSTPSKMDKYFRKLQLLSAAAFSLSHGSNDALSMWKVFNFVPSGTRNGKVHEYSGTLPTSTNVDDVL